MPIQRITAVDPCMPPVVRKELQKVAQNTEQYITFEGDVYNNLLVTPTTNPVSYFTGDAPSPGDTVVAAQNPPLKIQLTGNMTDGAGVWTATFKLITWNGSSYALATDEFTLTDIFNDWHHSLTGHQGLLSYDFEREVLYPQWLRSPTTRRGTIDEDLIENGAVTFTDMDDTKTMEVLGTFVRSGKKIASGSTVGIDWYPQAFYSGGAAGDGAWIVDVAKACLVDV